VGLSNAPSQAAALSAVPKQSAGMAAGAQSTLRYLGGVLSITLLSSVAGKTPLSLEVHRTLLGAFIAALVVACALCLLLPTAAAPSAR
jgi:sugar phosphate permease